MKTTGIIAEYNPFHNGHQYHLEQARRQTGADYVIVVMSGDFVQRGAPAVIDKHLRTKAALLGGADLVLELPVFFSTGSAGDFSAGAVSLLDKLGVVDTLCFGSESGTSAAFRQAAAFLADEPAEFSAALQNNLRRGHSFPLSRFMALQSCLSVSASHDCLAEDTAPKDHQTAFPADLFAAPNNILGVAYCTALRKRNSAVIPVAVRRKGDGYHADTLPVKSDPPIGYPSAQAIRRTLLDMRDCPDASAFSAFLPKNLLSLWENTLTKKAFLFPEDFTKELRFRLLLEAADGYTRYADIPQTLSDKLRKNSLCFTDWESLCQTLKTKELTYSRISRALCHILLSVTKEELCRARENDYVPYARILGFRKAAAPLLNHIKKNTAIPLVAKPADASRLLPDDACVLFRKDILSSHLYESALAAKTKRKPIHEYTRPLCIV